MLSHHNYYECSGDIQGRKTPVKSSASQMSASLDRITMIDLCQYCQYVHSRTEKTQCGNVEIHPHVHMYYGNICNISTKSITSHRINTFVLSAFWSPPQHLLLHSVTSICSCRICRRLTLRISSVRSIASCKRR